MMNIKSLFLLSRNNILISIITVNNWRLGTWSYFTGCYFELVALYLVCDLVLFFFPYCPFSHFCFVTGTHALIKGTAYKFHRFGSMGKMIIDKFVIVSKNFQPQLNH